MDTKQLWDGVLVELELSVSQAAFNTWFKNTCVVREEDGVIQLGVPNEFVKTWLSEKYHKTILGLLRKALSSVRGVEYVITKEQPIKKEIISQKNMSANAIGSLPLGELFIDKQNNLNPRYVFDSFVVGPFNELAYAASRAIVKNPGSTYNPFFIYGKTGFGKTHLIQAVGNEIKERNPNLKVYYMTSERFAIDFLNSIKSNTANTFKEKYRKYDVLIMDDIQFFSNKEKTQEELFHLFNTMHNQNKQILFSSDIHPNHLPNIQDRLRSRFSAGMTVDISPPDHESRVAILRTKSLNYEIQLSDEVVDFLATSVDTNIRELEGAFNTVICQAQLVNRDLNLNEVKNLIKNNIKTKRSVPIKNIVKIITDFYSVPEESIYKKTRKKEVVKPRQIIMYILREDFSIPYPTIGQKLGGRDHTTVIHSYEKIKRDIKSDSDLAQEINQIRTMI